MYRRGSLAEALFGEDEMAQRDARSKVKEHTRGALAAIGILGGYVGSAAWAYALGKRSEALKALSNARRTLAAIRDDVQALQEVIEED